MAGFGISKFVEMLKTTWGLSWILIGRDTKNFSLCFEAYSYETIQSQRRKPSDKLPRTGHNMAFRIDDDESAT